MNPSLAALLSPNQRQVYDAILDTAHKQDVAVYLVGGAVRDWLMGLPAGDLDFSTEGDAIDFARAVQGAHGGGLQVHEAFRTATWDSHGLHTDIATARSETYPRPGALPHVTPADMARDLLRRDFSINAMAYSLRDDALLDPLGGQADIRQRVIRVLHARSFSDDPTRILRGARYAARLGFAVEPQTRRWIAAGLPYFRGLSGERVKYDLELILDEAEPEVALNLLNEWGVFQSAGLVVPEREQMVARFTLARGKWASGIWDVASLRLQSHELLHSAGWGAMVYNLGQMSASRWIEWLPFTVEVRDALVALGALSTLSSAVFTARPSRLSQLLSEFSGLALFIGWLYDSDARKREAMRAEWHTWRRMQPVTGGDDLRVRGLPPGPRYRQLLSQLRDAWLDGVVHSAAEELAVLDRLLDSKSESDAPSNPLEG